MHKKEIKRLQAVHRFLNLEIDKKDEMQEIVQLAADLCDTPIALLTFIDSDMQYFAAKVGVDTSGNSRAHSFCNYLINQEEVMVVPDATNDDRFSGLPFVANQPHLRFYAGAPLNTHDGYTLGGLCVMDTRPKELSQTQVHSLKVLSKKVVQLLELDLSLNIMREQFLSVQDSEIKLRSFFENSGGCHALLGRNCEMLVFNKKLADFILRVHKVELYTGIPVSEILQGVHLEIFLSEYQAALSGKSLSYEREVDYKGEKICWYVSFEPAYNDGGEIIGVSYNCTDITRLKLNEAQINAQHQSLQEVAYMQSHEMRKPVASILGFMELFRQDNYVASKEDLQMMENATKELDKMIRQVVAASGKV